MQDVSGFHCQASSLRIQWPLPSQALHVLANPNIPQLVSGKLQSRDWLWIPAQWTCWISGDAPVVAQKTTSSWSLSQEFGFKQEFHTFTEAKIYHPSQKEFVLEQCISFFSNVLGDSLWHEISKSNPESSKASKPLSFFVALIGGWSFVAEKGSVPKYFHDLHCRVSWDCRSA